MFKTKKAYLKHKNSITKEIMKYNTNKKLPRAGEAGKAAAAGTVGTKDLLGAPGAGQGIYDNTLYSRL